MTVEERDKESWKMLKRKILRDRGADSADRDRDRAG
jgi:hypothetical protein